jgi:apolipoprotein N-acyltransferase
VHLGLSVAAALATALLLWAASPSVGLGWLAWVAIAPVAAASLRLPPGRAARLAVPLAYALYLELLLVPALPFGLDRNQWGEPVVPILVGDSPVVPVALLAIPLFGLLLYAVSFPQVLPCVPQDLGAVACVFVPALAWTGLDLLRTKADPGGLWGPLFLSQHDTAAVGLAAIGGPWLLTFAIVSCNYVLALLAVRGRAVLAPVAAGAVLVSLPLVLFAALGERDSGPKMTVAAVQPGYDTAEFGLPVLHYLRRAYRDHERATLDLVGDLAPLTREAARRGARIVVWPEATAWVDPRGNRRAKEALEALALETRAALVVPYFSRSLAQGAAAVVLSDGSLTRAQPKQRPMWFLGEDDGNREPARPVSLGADGFAPLRLGSLLGVDNQDPAPARTLAARSAELLTASTHDWAQMAVQQRAFSQLHAAALRLPVVRADWRFGSAVIDGDGRIVAEAPAGKRRAVVLAEVTLGAGTTPYARIGDAAGWSALALGVALWLAGRGRALVKVRSNAG